MNQALLHLVLIFFIFTCFEYIVLYMEEVIVQKFLGDLNHYTDSGYTIHILCMEGWFRFSYYDKVFVLSEGNCMILMANRQIKELEISEDFACKAILVVPQMLEKYAPVRNTYRVQGISMLYLDPIIRLSEDDFIRCSNDFDEVEYRKDDIRHHFYSEVLGCSLTTLFLDFFDFHKKLFKGTPVSDSCARLFFKFISLLEAGECKHTRTVSDYAEMLCITPKHLYSICLKSTGVNVTAWIDMFTVIEIKKVLADHSRTLTQISEAFNFSSLSYFSRYVTRLLGASPSTFR